MGRIFRAEFLKLRKSSIWLLIFVSPALAALIGLLKAPEQEQWILMLITMTSTHAVLFLPLLTGVFSAFVCRFEHMGGGWKQLLSLPIPKARVYGAKYLIVLLLIAATQILFLFSLLLVGWMRGFPSDIPWEAIFTSITGGWIACMPLAALQMLVSVAWSSFAAPLALNVILTLPNILVVNSKDFGPYYPWAQPFLAMMPNSNNDFGALNIPLETLFIVIFGSLLLFLIPGFIYFTKKEF
ncbi:MAG: ABC transporter permease [Thermoactinomyces sp.]